MALLAAIPEMTRAELLELWRTDHRRDAPKGISRRLLEYSAAYSAQVRAFGGLKPSTRRKLDRITAKPRTERSMASDPPAKRRLASGARLVREWHGRSHHVEVTDAGYVYKGKTFRSLSVIAREITGARWSGPRFFGL